METIEELKQFLTEQMKLTDLDVKSATDAEINLETPMGIDQQYKNSKGDTAMIFYLDRSEMFDDAISTKTINIKSMRVDIRGTKPKFITRTEWLELQPEAK